MNFAGILSRKAGRTVNMNANENASQVSNPEVAVAVMPEPKPKRVTNRSEAVAELKHRAEEVAPMAAPAQPAPAPKAAPTPQAATKTEAAPKPAPKAKRTAKAKATANPTTAPAPKAEEKPRLTIMEYSAKCLALFGDTKPIKDRLKKLGGRYNPHLHPFGQDTSVPGWVFPMKCRAELEKMIG